MDGSSLLSVENLRVGYETERGWLYAVDDVSLQFERGTITTLLGESGCGKSTLGLALSRLLPERNTKYSGKIMYNGVDVLSLKEDEMETYRGTVISHIFQEPMTSLNPVYRVGEQIAEAIFVKQIREERQESLGSGSNRSITLASMLVRREMVFRRNMYQKYSGEVHRFLTKVRIPNPETTSRLYPHELSGGMRQRVMIAMALAQSPSFLVADEPTTALDVTTQAQILNLIKSFTRELRMGVLLITHDLGVAAATSDYVSVMYAGKIVEEAPVDKLLSRSLHPYTEGLMASFPRGRKDNSRLDTISGVVPPLGSYPLGCRFHPRCSKAFEKCPKQMPRLVDTTRNHKVSCFLYGD